MQNKQARISKELFDSTNNLSDENHIVNNYKILSLEKIECLVIFNGFEGTYACILYLVYYYIFLPS